MRAGYKQTEVGEIPEDWEVQDFQQSLARLNAKNHQIQTREYREHGRHPVVDQGKKPVVGYSDADEKLLRVDDGGVIVFGDHTCITKYVNFPFVVGADGTQIIRSKNGDDTRFRYYDLEHKGIEPTGYNRHFSKLKERAFVTPKPSEQKAIADALSDVDALIGSLEKLIAKKRDIKTATMQQLLTGKTRLPGFGEGKDTKHSELGEIPEDWQITSYVEIGEIDPENLSSATLPEHEFNYISLEHVSKGVLKGYERLVFRDAPSRARRVLRRGDVLFGTVRPNLQSHYRFGKDEKDWVCSTGFAVLRPKEGIVCSEFVFLSVFSGNVQKQVETIIAGSNYPAVSSRDVSKLKIPKPEIEEQKAISKALTDMDFELTTLEASLSKTKAVKQGMMQELLTGRTRLV